MEKRWIVKEQGDEETVNTLSEQLGVDKLIANLLIQRGINNYEDAKAFFRPDLQELIDPFLMKDMDIAVLRLNNAILNNEKILIYGDYDVDGTTSVAMFYSFIKKRYSNIGYYIPDRETEGYGISFKGVDYAKDNGYSLIITLDCGIKGNEKVDYASTFDIDFIICDHHLQGDEVPKAVAVLDPKQHDCKYPFKELSGCGVGYKFLLAYTLKNNIPFGELIPYLDLVAVSIASDIVPIVGENRILSFFGLKVLNSNPRMGLKSIIKTAGMLNQEILINDIVFKIGPRINASGRLESGNKVVELLTTNDEAVADAIASEINLLNTQRKDLDTSITEEAINLISESPELVNKKTTVLYNPTWHKGVLGIVASRCTEHYYRPTIILTESNGLAVGSARSVPGFDLYKAIDACSDLLEGFGGHMFAAGLTLKIENIEAFQNKFEKVVSETINPDSLIPKIEVDSIIDIAEINPKLYRLIKQFQPFGPENMKPLFVTKNISDKGTAKIVGKENEHLKLDVFCTDNANIYLPCIAFRLSDKYNMVSSNPYFDVCYSIEENAYRGNVTLQLKVKDIKV